MEEETIYKDKYGLYHHVKKLTKDNIDKFCDLIHRNLHTLNLVNGWLETPNKYHYITRQKYLF